MKTKFIRIRYADYLRLRKIFPAMRKETTASYFQRLTFWLQTRGYLYDKI